MATFQYAYVEALQLLFALPRYAELVVEHCSRSDALGVQLFVGTNDSMIEILSDNLWSAFVDLQKEPAARQLFEKCDFLKTVCKQQFLEAFTWGLGLKTRKSSYYDSETRKPVNVKRVLFPAPPDFGCIEQGSYRACNIPHWFDLHFVRAALLQAWEEGTRDRHVKKLRTLERDKNKRPPPIHQRHVYIPPQVPYLAVSGTAAAVQTVPAHQMYYVATPVSHPQGSHELPALPYYQPQSPKFHNVSHHPYPGGSTPNPWMEHHLNDSYPTTSAMQLGHTIPHNANGARLQRSSREAGVAGLPYIGHDASDSMLGKRSRAQLEEESRSYGSLSQEACSGSSGNPHGERVSSRGRGKQAQDWCSSEQISAGGYNNNEEHTSGPPHKTEFFSLQGSGPPSATPDEAKPVDFARPSPSSSTPFASLPFSSQPLSPTPTTTPGPHPGPRPAVSEGHHSPPTLSNMSNADKPTLEPTMAVSTGAIIANPSLQNVISSTHSIRGTPDSVSQERAPTPVHDSLPHPDANRPESNSPTRLSQPRSTWESTLHKEPHINAEPSTQLSAREEEHPDLFNRQSQQSVIQTPSSQPMSSPLDLLPSPSEPMVQNVASSSMPCNQLPGSQTSEAEHIPLHPSASGPMPTSSADTYRPAGSQQGMALGPFSPQLADNCIAPIPTITIRGPLADPSPESTQGGHPRHGNMHGSEKSSGLHRSSATGGGQREATGSIKEGNQDHKGPIPQFRDSDDEDAVLPSSEPMEDMSAFPAGFASLQTPKGIKRIPIGKEMLTGTPSQDKLKHRRPRATSVLMVSPRGSTAPSKGAPQHGGSHSQVVVLPSQEVGVEPGSKIGSGVPIGTFVPGSANPHRRGESGGSYAGAATAASEGFLHGAPTTPQRNPGTPQKGMPGALLFTPPPTGPYPKSGSATLSPPSLLPEPHHPGGSFSRSGQPPMLSPLSQYYRSTHAQNFISILAPQHQSLSPSARTPVTQSPPPRLAPPSTFSPASHPEHMVHPHPRQSLHTPSKVSVRSMTEAFGGRTARDPIRGHHSLSDTRTSRSLVSELQHPPNSQSEQGGPSHSNPAGASAAHFSQRHVDDHYMPPNPWGQTPRRSVAAPSVVEGDEVQGQGPELVAQAGSALASALQYALHEIRILTERVEMLEDRISVLEGHPPGAEGPPA